MTNYSHDPRVVLTLDAGGTNFVFSALRSNQEIIEPVRLPSNADNLPRCLQTLTQGFQAVLQKLPADALPAAISFAFPDPADYVHGVIGDLPNLPAFRGGIPLGGYLEEQFHLPVFINNDGNLYAYGEALGGFLPHLNQRLAEQGSPRRYQNLIGITLGTAFSQALGEKRGICRYGDTLLPMDEALILSAVDLSGRSCLGFDLPIPTQKVGDFDTELVEEFWLGFVRKAECSLHIKEFAGSNSHHIIEGAFKSVARSLKKAVLIDPVYADEIPSTKGVL